MTTDNLSKRFVRRVLSPLVAVSSTKDLDQLCQLNHLPNFSELIQPFGLEMEGKVTLRDTKGLVKSISHASVRFIELDKLDPTTINGDEVLLSRNLSDLIKTQARVSELLRADPALEIRSPNTTFFENPEAIFIEETHNGLLIQALLKGKEWLTLF